MKIRLAAILIADITGYTAYLAQADRLAIEALVQQQKRLLTPLIEARGGGVVKWMGDAVLATFASSTEAVLSGRDMQLCVTREAERGAGVLPPLLKIVVHAGDVQFDTDGDIYGDAVNLTARMEKTAASDGEVYFSDSVRQSMNTAEIPSEPFGDFEFKGITGKVRVHRTVFGAGPVLRQKLALVQTNFTGVHSLAEKYGWDRLHPVLEDITALIVDSTRQLGGTHRGVMQNGCFLSFGSVAKALAAIERWQGQLPGLVEAGGMAADELRVRVAVHHGTLHLMRFTMMGRDIEIVKTLAVLGFGREVLLTDAATDMFDREGGDRLATPVVPEALRDCRSRATWVEKYGDVGVRLRPLVAA